MKYSIAVTIGRGLSFGIVNHPEHGPQIAVGPINGNYRLTLCNATKAEITCLQEHLERLKIHAD